MVEQQQKSVVRNQAKWLLLGIFVQKVFESNLNFMCYQQVKNLKKERHYCTVFSSAQSTDILDFWSEDFREH